MKSSIFALACLFSSAVQAWNCSYEKEISLSLDLAGSEQLTVLAAPGDLEINGVKDSDEARIKGRACVSEEEWLEKLTVETSAGRHAEIRAVVPDIDGGWSWTGPEYAYIDLEIRVPTHLALVVKDSSGDIDIRGVGALDLQDSSGDVEIVDIGGPLSIRDSSGDIELHGIGHDVTIIADSSGDIDGSEIEGSVRVEKDSSGDIHFSAVAKNFTVEQDSSGDISARDVHGDFRVLRDGSGDISASDIGGEVDIPDDPS